MNRRRQRNIPNAEQAHAQAHAQAQAQPERGPLLATILTRPLPLFIISLLAIAFSCTLTRLIVVAKLFNGWYVGVPGLCYGTIAHLDYGTMDPTAAFMLSSISKSISVATYGNHSKEVCHMRNYKLGNANGNLNATYVYLTVSSSLNIVMMIVVQGICWYRLFTTGCNAIAFLWCLIGSLVSFGLEVGSIYLASTRHDPAISGLSAIIFICAVVLLVLNAGVFRTQRRLGNNIRGVLRVPMLDIREVNDFVFGRDARPLPPMRQRDPQDMFAMYNAGNG